MISERKKEREKERKTDTWDNGKMKNDVHVYTHNIHWLDMAYIICKYNYISYLFDSQCKVRQLWYLV